MELVLTENYNPLDPVLETKNVEDVIPLRFTKERLILPHDKEDQFRKMRIPFINTSVKEIANVIGNHHPLVKNRANIVNAYYFDHRILYRCIKSNMIHNTGITISKGKALRFKWYDEISQDNDTLRTPFTINQLQGKNFIHDINPVIYAMKMQKKLARIPMMKRLKIFFDSINPVIMTTVVSMRGEYHNSPVFVDLDEYANQKGINDYHILTYLLLLLRKSDKFIAPFKADYKVLFYTKKGYLLFDMNDDMVRSSYNKLKRGIQKLKPEVSLNSVEKTADKEDIALQMNLKVNKFTGDDDDFEEPYFPDDEDAPEEPKEKPTDNLIQADDKIVGTIAAMVDENDEDVDDATEKAVDNALADLETDETLKKELADIVIKKNTGGVANHASSKRDEMLREKQKDVMIKNKTIGELTKDFTIPKVEQTKVEVPVMDEEIKTVKFDNFNKTYNDELMDHDIASVLTMFNDKSINMNVISVNVEDTSSIMNVQDTYTVVLEDEYRRRHTIKVNIPKPVDNNFLYINGGKKVIENHICSMPVIKTAEDTVYIKTNYNRMTIVREGSRFNPNIERFKKMVEDPNNHITYIRGSNFDDNRGEFTTLEYDDLSKRYTSVEMGGYRFVFNVKVLAEETDHKYHSDMDKMLIGYHIKDKSPVYYEKNDPNHIDMATVMVQYGRPEFLEDFKKMSSGKKYIRNTVTVMRRKIPVVVLLAFFEGITTVIHKFKDKNVKFVDKRSHRDTCQYIQFSDGFLEYPMSDTEACIMFNGLNDFSVSNYSVADLDDRQSYIDIFEELTGSGYVAGALVNFYDFMIDPITLEMLETLCLPTDIVSLIIYASNLLADSQYSSDLDLKNYRLRNMEIISAILYKQLSIAYSRYRASANNKNPQKMSVDPDCVIKSLQSVPTVTSYSYLGPITEIKTSRVASMRGYGGLNLDDSYTMEKRAYHESMRGVVGITTDNAKNCGKERHLVLEPKITNARGMFDATAERDVNKLTEAELVGPVEMLCPGGTLHDDPVRTAMSVKQKGHAIPVRDQSPLLVSNGIDAILPYRTGDDYSVVAQQDGTVVDVNQKLLLMTVEYKDGTKKAIDLYPNMAKNGGGGIYLKKQLTTSFKVGDKFKKDAILAFDPAFYKSNSFFGSRFCYGTLVKSAIMSNGATYEDSDFFTERLAKRMSSKISMRKRVILGKNSNVDYIVERGQTLNIGDELMRFETSYNDKELNELLAGIRDDLHETIVNLGKTRIRTKYEGTIDDIKCYPTIPLDEMSPSLATVVKKCQSIDVARDKYLNKLDPGAKNSPVKAGTLFTRSFGVVQPDKYGKIEGEDVVDSVLFEFYITFVDELSDGDKLVHMTANKTTLGDKIPPGFEPYSSFRPYEEISILQPPSAILQRGTHSIEPTMLTYKLLIELKRKQYKILTGESWNDKQKRENPYMDHTKKKVQEGKSYASFPDEMWATMESIFDLRDTTEGHVASNRFYEPGETIMMCNTDGGFTMESYGEKFYKDDNPNIRLDYTNKCVVALENIYPGEIFKI